MIATGSALIASNSTLLILSIVRRSSGEAMHLPSALACIAPGPVCLIISGASLYARSGGGLYWAVAGIGLTLFGGVVTAWILLVEILR